MPRKIALLCGNGALPQKISAHLNIQREPFVCVGFEGITDKGALQALSLYTETLNFFPLGHVEKILTFLKKHSITHIVMAGSMKRPSLSALSLDATGAKWLAKLGMSAFFGDDGLLKKLMELMGEEGFKILSPQDILPELLTPKGLLTHAQPCDNAMFDGKHGQNILKNLAHFDIGQAVVVQQGLVLGIEAIEGTAALLTRIIPYKREGFGGVLVKCAKPHQTLQVDLPTIGLATAKQVHQAGLAGIVLSAHTSQIIERENVLEYMNQHHIFLLGIE